MIKKSITYGALMLAMTACSVDDLNAPSDFGPDGEMRVTLTVPDMEQVGTRAVDEFKVSNLTMLIYSQNGFEQKVPYSDLNITQEGRNITVTHKLDQEVRTKSGLEFYFLANTPDTLRYPTGNTKAALRDKQVADQWNSTSMLMSAYAPVADIAKAGTISLRRNAAKVIVKNAVESTVNGETVWNPGDNWYEFDVYGTAKSSSLVAATIDKTDSEAMLRFGAATTSTASSFGENKAPVYVHPTYNPGRDKAARPFVVIKAPFEGQDYFYRVEFEKVVTENNATKVTKLDVEPNYEYRFLVKGVTGKGDATAAAAAKNPSSFEKIDVVVYDVCPQSYNMITDGMRELGVMHKLVHNGNPTVASNPSTFENLYVKLYSPDDSEYVLTAENIKASVSWLEFHNPELVTDNDIIGAASGAASSTKGKVYRVPVAFKTNNNPGSLKGTITVTWKGLSREVLVEWTRNFNGSELCSASLSIQNEKGQEMAGIADYWTFLQKKVYGVKTSQNNDSTRNAGLHFPLGYGVDDSHWWKYSYTLNFKDLNDGKAYDWEIVTKGVTGLTVTPSSGTNVTGVPETVKITFNPSDPGWTYQTGELVYRIKAHNASNDTYVDYPISLYHCGFFDNPRQFRLNENGEKLTSIANHRVDIAEEDHYYYYEVREGPSGKYHWLDRNLGAESAAYYIETQGELTYYGDSDAAGGYYRAAKYIDGGDPEMYADLCPPGFEIPSVEAWNDLRNSTRFSTSQSSTGSYYKAEFTNSKNQVVYFPRVLYYGNDRAKTGESRSGYYWTQTAASGLEKDQIGNWLRYLKFSGSIATYDNAQVEGKQGDAGYAMSVRCIAKTDKAHDPYRTYFRVKGATHVMLYSKDGSERNPVTNWPGTAIGNYLTMAGDNEFSFSYESPNTPPTAFYVLFTFRDADGIWHAMSNGGNGETLVSTTKNWKELEGWKVVDDDWKKPDGTTVKTALNGLWECNYQTPKVSFTPGDAVVVPPKPNVITYRVYWDGSRPWIYLWDLNAKSIKDLNGTQAVTDKKSYPGRYDSSKSKYYLEINAYDNKDLIGRGIAIYGDGNWNGQSGNLEIKRSDSNGSNEIYLNP